MKPIRLIVTYFHEYSRKNSMLSPKRSPNYVWTLETEALSKADAAGFADVWFGIKLSSYTAKHLSIWRGNQEGKYDVTADL